MKLRCPCGDWHDMLTLDVAVVLDAFMEGDMQRVNGKAGITNSRCFYKAYTESRVERMTRLYKDLTLKYKGVVKDEPETVVAKADNT
jgi:hypothetical protein